MSLSRFIIIKYKKLPQSIQYVRVYVRTDARTLMYVCFLLNDQIDAQFFMYLFIFLTLYMFRAHRAHHQERQILSIQALVAVTLCLWLCRVQVGSHFRPTHDTATDTE